MDSYEIANQLVVTRTVFPVRQFVSWYTSDQLDLRPPFQRLSVWKPKAKSYLIDTIVRGLPIPIVILRDRSGVSLEQKREVVDGQQRITTLLEYIVPERFLAASAVRLSRVHFGEHANKTFLQLPDRMKEAILNYEVSTHILPSSVDDQQVLRIFSRLNATGVQLNGQELRNAEFHGAFKTAVFELSLRHLNHWRSWGTFSNDAFARMREVEYTSELVVQMLYGISATTQARLNKTYEQFDDEFPDEAEAKIRFETIMDLIESNYGREMSTSEFSGLTWFYGLFGLLHEQLFGMERNEEPPYLQPVIQRKLDPGFWSRLGKLSTLIRRPDGLSADLIRALSGRTTNLNTRLRRAEFLQEQLLPKGND